MSTARWIVIPNWDRFQHYKGRRPVWIKVYTELMDDPKYLSLSFHDRGLLHGLWLMYGLSRGCVPLDLKMLNRYLNGAAKMSNLEALRDAGFIRFRASKPLAKVGGKEPLEVEKERETPKAFNVLSTEENLTSVLELRKRFA